MSLSLRDQVGNLLTEYSDLTRQFFQSLTTIAENTTTSNPDLLVKCIVDVDNRLQSALEQSKMSSLFLIFFLFCKSIKWSRHRYIYIC